MERELNGARRTILDASNEHTQKSARQADAGEERLDVSFDPTALADPRIAPDTPEAMVHAVREHLRRYGNHQSAKNTLARIEDARYLEVWDAALRAVHGRDVVFCGSELGVLALRAVAHGASRAIVLESYPLDVRVAAGVVRKNQLLAWHREHHEQAAALSLEEKEASFEASTRNIEVVAQAEAGDLANLRSPMLVLPNVDHSLLGTGVVRAIKRCRDLGLAPEAKLLPARAKVYALGFQWRYDQAPFELYPLNRFRWSFYPDTQDLPRDAWMPLTDVEEVGEIDFARFTEAVWETQLQVRTSGTLDGIMYWFELDLGGTRMSSAADGGLDCLKPAIQYADSPPVRAGSELSLRVHVNETRLHFATVPQVAERRSSLLPSWYMPMIHDRHRNAAYETALSRIAERRTLDTVVDIGAGCGLLSMLAVRAGAREVYGCEVNRAVCEAANAVLHLNGCQDSVKMIEKDCRKVAVPMDLPRRADVALFEMFDCSLIGEGVLHFLAYARENLLDADACYVPRSARIRAALIEQRVDTVLDVDVNLLNPYRFAPGFINVNADRVPYRALSEPFDVFAFDFTTATPEPGRAEISIAATADGMAGAVLFWFDLCLDDDVWLSNQPHTAPQAHWKQGLQFLPEAHVTAGQSLAVTATHDGSSLEFRWADGGLAQTAFSRLPRYDRVAWHDASLLEARTHEILRHCSADRAEYEKLVDLAMRFAIDPAAHDLDPKVAQRFAELLLRVPS